MESFPTYLGGERTTSMYVHSDLRLPNRCTNAVLHEVTLTAGIDIMFLSISALSASCEGQKVVDRAGV